MPVSRALRRLLQVRDLEEEQHRRAVESANAELRALENAKSDAVARGLTGRELMRTGAHTGEVRDRQSGLVESYAAEKHARALAPRIARAETEAAGLREAFLRKRIERRQAETLIEETIARDAIETARLAQKMLDEWYRSRPVAKASKEPSAHRPSGSELEIKVCEDKSAVPSTGAKPKL